MGLLDNYHTRLRGCPRRHWKSSIVYFQRILTFYHLKIYSFIENVCHICLLDCCWGLMIYLQLLSFKLALHHLNFSSTLGSKCWKEEPYLRIPEVLWLKWNIFFVRKCATGKKKNQKHLKWILMNNNYFQKLQASIFVYKIKGGTKICILLLNCVM